MVTANVTTKGQVTIPVEVRQRLGIESGGRIEFVEIEGGYAIRPAINDVRSLKGLLRKPLKPVTINDMNAAIRVRGASR